MPMKKQKWFFSLNSSSPAKVSQKRVAPNNLGILQENIYESLIFKKVTTQWTGPLEKGNLLFRLLREFSEVRERGESYSLIS